MNIFRCDVCGRFIPYADLDSGEAIIKLITPDSAYTPETWETLCREHNNYKIDLPIGGGERQLAQVY